jgi:hypothetical protein
MSKRFVAAAIGAACLVVGLALAPRSLSRGRRPIRITSTVFVAPDGRRVAGFLEGKPSDLRPDLDSESPVDASRSRDSGILGRMLRLIETTVYGAENQPACTPIECNGSSAACSEVPCGNMCEQGTYTACASNAGGPFFDGSLVNGSHGCSGDQCNMHVQDCDMDICDNGSGCQPGPTGGDCPLGQYCRSDHTCQPSACLVKLYCRAPADCCDANLSCDGQGCCVP